MVAIAIVLAACGGSSTPRQTPGIAIEGTLVLPEVPKDVTPVQKGETQILPPAVPFVAQPEKVSVADRIIIPKINVSAPLVILPFEEGKEMPAPTTHTDVGYYSFPSDWGVGGKVGSPGNAIFAGHVDLVVGGSPKSAVFWDLNKLKVGDEVKVKMGTDTYTYSVTSNQPHPASADNFYWNKLLAAGEGEKITVITCTGKFDPITREYTDRQVVVAVRVP